MAVKGNHKKVIFRTYSGPAKLEIQSTGAVLAFREFHPREDKKDRIIFEYTYVPPALVRGVWHEDFAGLVGRKLPLTPEQLDTMLRKEYAKPL